MAVVCGRIEIVDKATEEEIEAAVRNILPELRRFAPDKKQEYAEDVVEVIRRCFSTLKMHVAMRMCKRDKKHHKTLLK